MQGNGRPTRLNIRDAHAARVHQAMLIHADEIEHPRDVLKLDALRDLNGECVAVAIADLVAQQRVVGASGSGRIRAIERENVAENVVGGWLASGSSLADGDTR